MDEEEVLNLKRHAFTGSINPAATATEGMSALETQLERERMKEAVINYAFLLRVDGREESEFLDRYDEITNRLVRTKLQMEQLRSAIRRKHGTDEVR
jgi:hypothetical protein